MELNPAVLEFHPFAGVSVESGDHMVAGTTRDALGLDIAGHVAGDMGVFKVPFKCDVVLAMVEITEGLAGGTLGTAEIKFDRRFTSGSDTGRADGDVADINLGVTGVSAAGDVAYDLVGMGVTLEPGMEVVVECVTAPNGAGEAGHIWPHLLVRYRPETRANLSALQATT